MSTGYSNELREGACVAGAYTLERSIRQDGASKLFAAVNGNGERALIELAPARGFEAERQFEAWQRARHLRHENLLYVRDAGRAEMAGENYIYGVFDYPDDFLAAALEQGPLSEEETREVLEAALAALRYLHGQGMVHGAVDAAHIVAVGDCIKLAPGAVRDSGDWEGRMEDVRQLGELARALRGGEPVSEPLATVVLHATAAEPRERWSLAEIACAIEGQPAPAPTPPENVEAAPPAPPPAAIEPVAAPAAPIPVQSATRPAQPFPKWIFAGLALLLAVILTAHFRRKPENATPVTPAAPTVSQPARPNPEPARRATALAPRSTGKWRVIAFTYRSRAMAERKAKEINKRWSNLYAEVFAPRERRGYYLVALGGRMSREEAIRVQHRARGLGLPRDTYVQNYSE